MDLGAPRIDETDELQASLCATEGFVETTGDHVSLRKGARAKPVPQRIPNRDRSLDLFVYYLERHIQLDGEEHSELAKKMLTNLCENDDDKWAESAAVAALALKSRRMLWDSVVAKLRENREAQAQPELLSTQAAGS